MLLHEFGANNVKAKTVLMIHGLAMSWDMLRPAIDLAADECRIIAVAVPGMDMDEQNEFTSVERIARQIEDELLAMGLGEIDCIYGLSMGGGIAIRMLADDRVRFRCAIIDAGITPYELPWLQTRLILAGDVLSTLLGKASKKLLELAFPPEDYTQQAVDRMYEVMRHMTLKTIWRAYDSTDNYSMPERFPELETSIQYWYGSKEKRARKLDIQYVQKHIPDICLREIPDMAHGQYIMAHPEQFVLDMKNALARL